MTSRFTRIFGRLIKDDCGGANAEYAVVIGLILLAVVAVVSQFGPKVLARWASVGNKLGGGDGSSTVVTNAHPSSAVN
jgi:Flp pilus assembly pilin Flp